MINKPPQVRFSDALGQNPSTAVSPHEKISGFLIAAVGLAGSITLLLALLFFLNMEWEKSVKPTLFVFTDFAGAPKPEGVAEDFEELGVNDLAEVDEHQLADSLEMVTQAVSNVRAAIEKIDGTSKTSSLGTGLGDKRKTGLGKADGKGPNPAEHWIVKYSASSKETYAAQLDFFKIEIGSVSKTSTLIEYAFDVSASKPKYKKGSRTEEKRVFFKKPSKHPALRWDKALLEASGAETDDRIILTFYPNETFKKLRQLEQDVLKRDDKQIEDVKTATFTVEATKEGGFEYKLNSVKYK